MVPTVPLVIGDDVEQCAAPVRPYAALYIGGMGSREQNFYNDAGRAHGLRRRGRRGAGPFLARDYDGAAAAVPFEFVDRPSLLGPLERIAERMAEFAAAGVTTLTDRRPFGDRRSEDKLRVACEHRACEALQLGRSW